MKASKLEMLLLWSNSHKHLSSCLRTDTIALLIRKVIGNCVVCFISLIAYCFNLIHKHKQLPSLCCPLSGQTHIVLSYWSVPLMVNFSSQFFFFQTIKQSQPVLAPTWYIYFLNRHCKECDVCLNNPFFYIIAPASET